MTPQQESQQPASDQSQAQNQPPLDMGQSEPRKRTSNSELLALIVENTPERAVYASRIVDAELYRDAFDQDWRAARVFAMSGVFKDITGVTQNEAIATAMTKIRMGRSWGISEADAMQFIYFTNGRPAVMNELVAAKMREAGFDWDIEWHMSEGTGPKRKCIGCTLWLKKRQRNGECVPVLDRAGEPVSESFTKEDADAALIWEKGKQIPLSQKWNFISWPKDMYFWRTVGRLKKYHCTDILRGAVMSSEAQDMVETAPGEWSAKDHEKATTLPPDDDPRWKQTGSAKDAAAVAEEKIRQMEERAGAKPGADTGQPMSPVVAASIKAHLDKQEDKLAEEPAEAPRTSRPAPKFGRQK